MFARTCWSQVPHRTLYSIIRDMCDCLVSRIHPTPRMPLAYMRISLIRLDLFSTAFTLLDILKQSGESSPESWAWALSPSFAIEICGGVDFFDHVFCVLQYVQKKHPMYSSMKEDTVWSFERLQSYIDENYVKEKELPENWVYTTFTVSFCIRALLLVIYCLRVIAVYFVTTVLLIAVSLLIVIGWGKFSIFWPDINVFTCSTKKR